MCMARTWNHSPFLLQIAAAQVLERSSIVGWPRTMQLRLEMLEVVGSFQYIQEEIYAQLKPPFLQEICKGILSE